MKKELLTGSSKGIALKGVTFGQKIFSTTVASAVTLLLVIIPNIF